MKKMMVWIVGAMVFLGGALHAQDKDLSGNWQGTLQAGGNGLRLVLKVSKDDGKLKATMYSIDQGGQAIPVNTISLEAAAVNFAIKPLDFAYVGTLNPDGNSISGNATQGGQTHVLNLARVAAENTWAIPEPPKPMPKDAQPSFEVVTIKPGMPNSPGKNIGFRGRHFIGRNFNVDDLIALSYGMHTKQIIGAPEWFNTELFDIDGVPDVEGVPSQKQEDMMMEKLLADRFGLKFHHEQRELSVFAITVAKSGPKMTVSTVGPDDGIGFGFRKLGDLSVHNMTITDFAKWMQASVMDRPVVDQTGLKDRYDFQLKWTPDDSQFAQFGPRPPQKESDDPNAPPSLFTALQEQLGLKMDATKAMTDVIVIDKVEKPGAN